MESRQPEDYPVTQDTQTIETIANQMLGIDTLETRNRDGLDFHDLAVWQIKAALEAAFAAGRNSHTDLAAPVAS